MKNTGPASTRGIKRLIVNADDFGLHASINESVDIAHREGVLTSASLAVGGKAFEQAVDIARKNSDLGVGLHITLVEEEPVSPAEKIRSIVDDDGKLLGSYTGLCSRILTGKAEPRHIAAECAAQIEKFLKTGLVPTHIDSHQHLHLFPPIWKILDPILKGYGIRRVRSLKAPFFDYRPANPTKTVFALFSRYTDAPGRSGYTHPDYFLGFFKSGDMDGLYIKKILPKIPPGVTEISFHPGTDNDSIARRYGSWSMHHAWKCDWVKEYRLLIDPDTKKAIESNGIELINYSQI